MPVTAFPQRVFVDTCWLQAGFQKVFTTETAKLNWGGHEHVIAVPSVEAKVFPAGVLSEEAPLLAEVARLAEAGRVKLFVSELVWFESFGAPGTSQPGYPGHVFERCVPERVKTGFIYSIAFGHGQAPLRAQLRRSFERYPDPVLARLRERFGPRNLMDCVHLLTAERHGMDFFLCDRRFTRTYRPGLDDFHVWPVVPSELLRNLHVRA